MQQYLYCYGKVHYNLSYVSLDNAAPMQNRAAPPHPTPPAPPPPTLWRHPGRSGKCPVWCRSHGPPTRRGRANQAVLQDNQGHGWRAAPRLEDQSPANADICPKSQPPLRLCEWLPAVRRIPPDLPSRGLHDLLSRKRPVPVLWMLLYNQLVQYSGCKNKFFFS